MSRNMFWKFYFLSIFIHLRCETSLIGCISTVFYFNIHISKKKKKKIIFAAIKLIRLFDVMKMIFYFQV